MDRLALRAVCTADPKANKITAMQIFELRWWVFVCGYGGMSIPTCGAPVKIVDSEEEK